MQQYNSEGSEIILQALGLNFQPNHLTLPPGSMLEASNVEISRDNVVEPSRGYKLYGSTTYLSILSSLDLLSFNVDKAEDLRIKQILFYKNRVIQNVSNTTPGFSKSIMFYDKTKTGEFKPFLDIVSGSDLNQPDTSIRTKYVEKNNNLYFTSTSGIRKIALVDESSYETLDEDSTNPEQYIDEAGAVQAIDPELEVIYGSGSADGFMPLDSAVSYRTLWVKKDVNGNLIRGVPSNQQTVIFSRQEACIQDLNLLTARLALLQKQTGVAIDGVDYKTTYFTDTTINYADYSSPQNASGPDLALSIQNLAEAIDSDINLLDINNSGTYLNLQNLNPSAIDGDIFIQAGNTVTYCFTTSKDPNNFMSIGDQYKPKIYKKTGTTVPAVQTQLDGVLLKVLSIKLNETVAPDGSWSGITHHQVVFQAVTDTTLTNGYIIDGGNNFVTPGNELYMGLYSFNYQSAIETPSTISTDPVLPIPETITEPTNNRDISSIHFALKQIINRLQSEKTGIIPTASINLISDLDITTTANVYFKIRQPKDIYSTLQGYFLQIYRSSVKQALDVTYVGDLVVEDEHALVYEDTTSTISGGPSNVIEYLDNIPDGFTGANLYTNQYSGETIAKANFKPPYSLDVTTYNGHTFYANTKQQHQLSFSLNSILNLRQEYLITSIIESGANIVITLSANEAPSAYPDEIVIRGSDCLPSMDGGTFAVLSHTAYSGGSFTVTIAKPYSLTQAGTTGVMYYLNHESTDRSLTLIQSDYASLGNFVPELKYPFFTALKLKSTLTASQFSSTTANYIKLTYNNDIYYIHFTKDSATPSPVPTEEQAILINIPINTTGFNLDNTTNLIASTLSSILGITTSVNITGADKYIYVLGHTSTLTLTSTPTDLVIDATLSRDGWEYPTLFLGTSRPFPVSTELSPSIALTETTNELSLVINRFAANIFSFTTVGNNGVPVINIRTLKYVYTGNVFVLTNSSASFYTDINFIKEQGSYFNITTSLLDPDGRLEATAPEFTSNLIKTGDRFFLKATGGVGAGLLYEFKILRKNSANSVILERVQTSDTTNIVISGSTSCYKQNDQLYSDNSKFKNYLYYSKYNEPEAVPLINYIGIGDGDKAILRVFPLRDSLFIFKEDGLFRLTGSSEPFIIQLFDKNTVLIAPDSLASSSNMLFGWCESGVNSISETGARLISRAIDPAIVELSSSKYINFKTAAFGLGYDSDSTYTIFYGSDIDDTTATNAFKYNQITNTWTSVDRNHNYYTASVNPADDKIYYSPEDAPQLEVERKDLLDTDYAGREYNLNLGNNQYISGIFNNGFPIEPKKGDYIIQNQPISAYDINSFNLALDNSGVFDEVYSETVLSTVQGSSITNAYAMLNTTISKLLLEPLMSPISASLTILPNTLTIQPGLTEQDLDDSTITRISLVTDIPTTSLLVKDRYINIDITNSTLAQAAGFPSGNYKVIDFVSDGFGGGYITIKHKMGYSYNAYADTDVKMTTLNTSLQDIKGVYNYLVEKINLYAPTKIVDFITETTTIVSPIVSYDKITNRTTVLHKEEFLPGEITIVESIPTKIVYSPISKGDPRSYKQYSNATVMLENNTFTSMTIGFASNILPAYQTIIIPGKGNGWFGTSNNFGAMSFGGIGNAYNIRTFVPREKQRCHYLNVSVEHCNAYETYALNGITVTAK